MTFRTVSATRSVARSKRAIILALAFALALLALPAVASAASLTWTGTTSTDYNVATNWSPNAVPSSSDSLSIGAATNQPTCGATETCSASSITVTAPGNLSVTGGTLEFGTLTVDNSTDLTLTSGTIGALPGGNTATIQATAAVVLTNTGVNYGASTGDTLALGARVELDQTNPVTQQGTLNIGSHTFDLIANGNGGTSIGVAAGDPVINIGNGGLMDNEGTGGSTTDTVAPQVVMTSGATLADHSDASPEKLVLANSASGASPNQYQGTINETGSSALNAIVLGNDAGCSAVPPTTGGTCGSGTDGSGAIVGSLTTLNASHDRSNSEDSKVVIFTSSADVARFDLGGNTVTMNGDLTLDGSNGGTISGNGTFQSAASCSPANCVGDLLIHDGQFSGPVGPASQTITIPSGTTAVVENHDATWNHQFTFAVNGVLLIDNQNITTTAAPASAPTINIASTALMNHLNGASMVEPVVNSSGTIEESGGGLSLGNPNGVNTDTLSGTLLTQGQSCATCGSNNSISLGFSGAGAVFKLTGPLTSDTFTQHAGGAGAIGTADSATDLQLNGQTLTIAGDGTTNYEFTHGDGQITGPGTVDGPGQLLLAGGDLTPASAMTFNAPVDQAVGSNVLSSAGDTNVEGTGGHLTVNSNWTTSNSIGSGAGGTDVTISAGNSLVYTGGGTDVVQVPLIVNGSLTDVGSGSWTFNNAPSCPGTPTVTCTTTIGSTGTVNVEPFGANSGTLQFNDLTNVGGHTPTNTLTGGTYNIGTTGTLQLPTAGSTGVHLLQATLDITGGGSLQDTSGNSGLAQLTKVDTGATLDFLNHSDTTALTLIDGTVILDGSSSLDNSNAPTSGTTVETGGLLTGSGGSIGSKPLTNNGTVFPGDGAGSAGTLTVTGRYSQGVGGTLDIDLNGTSSGQYGLLSVIGAADFGGTLNLTPSAAYAASAGTGDDIAFGLATGLFTAGHVFATVNVSPAFNNGRTVSIDYTEPGEVEVVVGPPTIIVPPAKPVNSVLPAISGTAKQGQTLSTTNGTWTGSPTFTYQWADCNASGTGCASITGATASSYTLTASDVGDTVAVIVTATNAGGSTPAASNPTAVVVTNVVPPPPPPIKQRLSGVGLASKSFKASGGTSLNLKLAVAGKVKVVITEILSGHKVNGVCKASAKKGKKCTTKKQVRTVTFTGKAGANKFSFKLKGLKKGSYSAKLTATNSAGKTSNAVTVKFTLK